MRELPEARHLGDALDAFLQMSTGRAADQLADEIAPRTRPSHRPELEDSDTNRTPRIGP
jgi:hypothetical protein